MHKPSAVLLLCTMLNFLLFLGRYYASLPPPKWVFYTTGLRLPTLFVGLALYLIYKFWRQKKRLPLTLYAIIPLALANYWLFSSIFDEAVRVR
jgi:peptidoglycan/LPS O-acetylase OafA/YrhL